MAKKGKAKLQKESIQSKYELLKELGEGGNAKVYLALEKSSGDNVALKCLQNRTEEKEHRFQDEINIMRGNSEVGGILPILDYDSDNLWYTMPIASPIMEVTQNILENSPKRPYHLGKFDRSKWITTIVKSMIQLASTLDLLHNKNIHHRDIKPDNIYLMDCKCYIGDFGLVEFPDNENNYTREDKGLGAIFTIAPEMKRNPKDADGAKADVYSLAKSLWMLLTGDNKGFDGQYSWNDPIHGLRFYTHLSDEYLVEIEKLLYKSTNNNPLERPDISEFKDFLIRWLEIYQNQYLQEVKEWEFLVERIFGEHIPTRTEYRDPEHIVKVLNILGQSGTLNHMLFPDGGGLDFTYAEVAAESGFIYVYCDKIINLIKPRSLYFESFPDSRWNYFMIECEEVEPIGGVYISHHGDQELVEDYPGHYVKSDDAIYNVYDYDTGEPLPADAKVVCRFTKGKFLIVMKTCTYNHIPSTYDGRHSLMSNEEFRKYIFELQSLLSTAKEKGYNEDEILNNPKFGSHPYPERVQLFEIENNSGDHKRPNPDSFIKENFQSWHFNDEMTSTGGDGKLAFHFVFELESEISFFDEASEYYLSVNGTIKKRDKESADYFEVYDRNEAIRICDRLNNKIIKLCADFDVTPLKLDYKFIVKWRRVGMPAHLFTKEEIENEMRNADDRMNNQLVIDEDGYAHVIPISEKGYGSLYPVSHEIWGSRKNYVGRYSNLCTLDNDYADSLNSWFEYLSTGRHIYCDLNSYPDLSKLHEQISVYYPKED